MRFSLVEVNQAIISLVVYKEYEKGMKDASKD